MSAGHPGGGLLVLLPPSETKRDGGDPDRRLDLGALSYPELARPRRTALAALRREVRTVAGGLAALRLGPGQRAEVERDRVLGTAPTMPAIERYTGVLYDALDVASLADGPRRWVRDHVVVHSALFGLVGADDPIPAYRLSHDSRLTGLPLKRHWRQPIGDVLAREAAAGRFVLDLRSESYVELGPARWRSRSGADAGSGANAGSAYVRVVSEAEDGRRSALNHFNKAGKGALVRALAESGADPSDREELLAWARGAGVRLVSPTVAAAPDGDGSRDVLELIV